MATEQNNVPGYRFLVALDATWLLLKRITFFGALFVILMNGVSAYAPMALVNSIGWQEYNPADADGCKGYRANSFNRDEWRAGIKIFVVPGAERSFDACKAKLRSKKTGFIAQHFLGRANFELVVLKPPAPK